MAQTPIDSYDDYEVPAGGGVFLKVDIGETRIRLCSKPVEIRSHDITTGSKFTTAPCQGDKCELCKQGKNLVFKYGYLVINRKDGRVCVYETPLTVFRKIVNYARNPEYGDPTKYDITIKKEGEGRNTTYDLIASPKQAALTKEELDLIESSGVSLEAAYAEKK